MGVEIWVAIISSGLSFLGVLVTVVWGNKKGAAMAQKQTELTLYRINQLEEKVNKHNNLIERVYIVEKRLDVDEEKIKVANHRLDDIEHENK